MKKLNFGSLFMFVIYLKINICYYTYYIFIRARIEIEIFREENGKFRPEKIVSFRYFLKHDFSQFSSQSRHEKIFKLYFFMDLESKISFLPWGANFFWREAQSTEAESSFWLGGRQVLGHKCSGTNFGSQNSRHENSNNHFRKKQEKEGWRGTFFPLKSCFFPLSLSLSLSNKNWHDDTN